MTAYYRAKSALPAFKAKEYSQEQYINDYPADCLFQDVESPEADEEWALFWEYDSGSLIKRDLWIQREYVRLDPAFKPIYHYNEEYFVLGCVLESLEYNNDPKSQIFHADFDYLLALAAIQSNFDHAAENGPHSEYKGIFGITDEDWDGFCKSDAGQGYQQHQIMNPLAQISSAIQTMTQDAKALSDKWMAVGVGDEERPYLPRLGELLRCRIIGVDMTFELQRALKKELGSNQLKQFLIDNGMSETSADALMTYREDLMLTDTGSSNNLRAFSDACDKILSLKLEDALKLLKKYAPDVVSVPAGSAPWMDIAEKELADGIKESTIIGKQRIEEYFDATGAAHLTHTAPWCAAFVSWCIQECGGKVEESYQHFKASSARAAQWRNWGKTLKVTPDKIPVGAIILLSASSKTEEVSHVGFFQAYDKNSNKIKVLSGNFSNAVKSSLYKVADIVSVQWHAQASPNVSPGAPEDVQPLLNFIGQIEAAGNYNARFGNAKSASPDFTAMPLDKVLEWQQTSADRRSTAVGKYQFIRSTLNEVMEKSSWGRVVADNETFTKELQDELAKKLLEKRKLSAFLAGALSIVDFGEQLAMEWAALPVLEGHKRGRSYYAGDGLNKAHANPEDVEALLKALNPNAKYA